MNMRVFGDTTGLEGDAEGPLKGGAADRFLGRGSTDAATSLRNLNEPMTAASAIPTYATLGPDPEPLG